MPAAAGNSPCSPVYQRSQCKAMGSAACLRAILTCNKVPACVHRQQAVQHSAAAQRAGCSELDTLLGDSVSLDKMPLGAKLSVCWADTSASGQTMRYRRCGQSPSRKLSDKAKSPPPVPISKHSEAWGRQDPWLALNDCQVVAESKHVQCVGVSCDKGLRALPRAQHLQASRVDNHCKETVAFIRRHICMSGPAHV